MGQQQLLYIVLGIIVVALAIFIGVQMFVAHAIESKRNNVINECVQLSAMAQQYYYKPTTLGGGGRSFTGWTIPTQLVSTTNGRYEADISSSSVVLTAIGTELVTDTDSIEVEFTITPTNYQTVIVH